MPEGFTGVGDDQAVKVKMERRKRARKVIQDPALEQKAKMERKRARKQICRNGDMMCMWTR